ncbi:MAG: PLP-dependent transferase [Fidelibacterota bacterium]|nr:MAG: PLP-dependent transferase [Candidatus Neomarinimicrobiota bacterium]
MKQGFATRAIHVGQEPDPGTGAVVPPVYQTTTFAQEDPGIHRGFIYSRAQNPTRTSLEQNLASLEGGRYGIAFASGMAALSALVMHFGAGDHFVVGENIYGGTYRVLTRVFNRFNIKCSWVDSRSVDNIAAAITSTTRAVIIETPSNPMMTLSDIEGTARLARDRDLLCVVDNTFMSPYCQRPLELGAHVAFHSVTKYLAGHSDVLMGVLITSEDDLAEDLYFVQKSVGAVPSPFDCWLASRSLKTLAVRIEQHSRNALTLARFLDEHSEIKRVYYPGLPTHPGHELAARQQSTPDGHPVFGGMISLETGSLERARMFIKNLAVFTLAESLGGVESLVEHPAIMTHADVPREKREALGLTDGLVRLSVGIEDLADLQDDLAAGLAALA